MEFVVVFLDVVLVLFDDLYAGDCPFFQELLEVARSSRQWVEQALSHVRHCLRWLGTDESSIKEMSKGRVLGAYTCR